MMNYIDHLFARVDFLYWFGIFVGIIVGLLLGTLVSALRRIVARRAEAGSEPKGQAWARRQEATAWHVDFAESECWTPSHAQSLNAWLSDSKNVEALREMQSVRQHEAQ